MSEFEIENIMISNESGYITESKYNLKPLDVINGFEIRPGFYEINGATAIPGGVNFTIHSHQATNVELLLFERRATEPCARIPFPEHYRIGNVYSMIVFKLDIEKFEYAYSIDGPYQPEKGIVFDKTKYILDPYAKAVSGQGTWGEKADASNHYKARVVRNNFDWANSVQPLIPLEDVIIYEMHVRGFTMNENSEVDAKGTFAGIMEKLPYLKELGVTAVELMPIFEFDEIIDNREYNGKKLMDYWGYNTVSFFAPNTSYCSTTEYNHEGNELKQLIRALNQNGIEVYLDVVFNHTAEGNENGPFFSFKGIDNNIYYLLTPNGYYYNFSGCGNTINCNHPIVQQMIMECLRYWVTEYRVDGFRFDLASILGRNEDGSPMSKPPLLQSLAFDPILGKVKLIAEAWDAGGLYQVGSFPSWNRWMEWNGRYRDDIRSFLKGDRGMVRTAVDRICGSPDIYRSDERGEFASVNFVTCHDGFTLYDLYSYNTKHNEMNGWNNTDGSDNNYSWNCGFEGETEDEEVNRLRRRLVRNACAVLMLSRGIPMFLAGDEFCNTQFGNNNSYCQDNIISWLDWSRLKKYHKIYEFFKNMITFRKSHRIIRIKTDECSINFPQISYHGHHAWEADFENERQYAAIMYAGRKLKDGAEKNSENRGAAYSSDRMNSEDDIIYIGINTYWEEQNIELPRLPVGLMWKQVIDTWQEDSFEKQIIIQGSNFDIMPRSIKVFVATPTYQECL